MSAKFLHAFTEENSELQKQIGCMAGIFQVFDRHNLLGGRRFKGRHNYNNKRITSGNSSVNVSNPDTNNVASSPQLVLERNISANQRTSLESSRTSFSSSTSSSFSSIDCNKSTLHGSSSFNQSTFQDKSVKNSPKSVNEDPRTLSVKTSLKEDFRRPVLSYIDSPRPIQLSKSVDGSYVIGGIDCNKSGSPLDLNESLRVLMKLKETPRVFEAKEVGLNRRLSYDGRETSTGFLDSRENGKPSSKLKELPRLSLDSRESSIKSSNSIMKGLDRSRSNKEGNFTHSNGQKDFGNKKSAPSVVAKLMGLEVMPTLCSTHEEQVDVIKNYSLSTSNDVRPPFDSLRSFQKDLARQGVKSPVVISTPYFTVKTTIEPAPWKKEKLRVAQNASKQRPQTIYSEIEKRLNDLEFHYANKDLRALKQILDAIQAKGLLESKKNEQQHSPKLVATRNDENLGSPVARKPPLPTSTKGISAKKTYDPPIVIMKPAKSLNRLDVAAASVFHLHGLSRIQRLRTSEVMDKKKGPCSSNLARDCSPRASPIIKGKNEENNQKIRLRAGLGSSRPQHSSRENNEKSSNSVSPRLLQRKLEVESRIRSSVPSSESRKHQNLSTNKQTSESVSPRNKLRRRPTTSQQGGDMNSASQLHMEDALAKNFISPEHGAQKNPPIALDEGASTVAMTAEQPSPISVLDATFYPDDLRSVGVKRSTNIPKGNKLPNSNNFYEPHKIDSEINQKKKLESIGNLLQKLEELNSSTETTSNTDHIASLCETHNPNHRYISEILLASGLLMEDFISAPIGLMPIQCHPTEHPINPDLFLVLEQTKSNSENINGNTLPRRNFAVEKLHRKLVFDVVNEILVQKTCLSSHPMLLPARKLHDRLPSGKQLLKQLCSEIDQLQAEALEGEEPDDDDDDNDDNMIGEAILRQLPLDWNDHRRELGAIVLDIERSIFKDMIDEVVCVEACSLKQKSCRRRRQLFAK